MIFAAAFFGCLFAASTPPIDFLPGALFGLLGLAWVLGPSPRRTSPPSTLGAGLAGGSFGLSANLLALRFVPEVVGRFTSLPPSVGVVSLLLLSLAQALPWAACGAVTRTLEVRARAPFPWAFAVGVYAASFVPSLFPWTAIGALSPWPVLVQSAELVGEGGASALLALIAGWTAIGLSRLRASSPKGPEEGRLAPRLLSTGALRPLASATLLTLTLLGFGALRMHQVTATREAAKHARVAILQPSFEAGDRWDPARARAMHDRLTALTVDAEARGAELTVWPESAYPYTLAHDARTSPSGDRSILRPSVHGPVVTGIYMVDAEGASYNSAALATNDGRLSAPYDKRHLLWFGETIPLADTFPSLRKLLGRGPGLVPGDASVVLETDGIRAAILNCYEDTLGVAGREAMAGAPNLLINITNDAWFAGSAESELHLRLAVARAVETRRDLVRAVNRGPTSHVGADGRVLASYAEDQPGFLLANVALLDGSVTPFVRFGHFPMTSALAIFLAWSYARARRADKSRRATPS